MCDYLFLQLKEFHLGSTFWSSYSQLSFFTFCGQSDTQTQFPHQSPHFRVFVSDSATLLGRFYDFSKLMTPFSPAKKINNERRPNHYQLGPGKLVFIHISITGIPRRPLFDCDRLFLPFSFRLMKGFSSQQHSFVHSF